MKGTLSIYFATGEEARLQFVGYNSLNKEGFVVNYDEIYDIELEDQIKLTDSFFNTSFATIKKHTYDFLWDLSLIMKEELKVEYKPNINTRSWQQNLDRYKENQMAQHKPTKTKKSGNGSKRK